MNGSFSLTQLWTMLKVRRPLIGT